MSQRPQPQNQTETEDEKKKKPRQGRIHFKPEISARKVRPFQMAQFGLETLEFIAQHRLVTGWQIGKRFFLGTPSGVGNPRSPVAARTDAHRYCLRILKDLGLVKTRRLLFYNDRHQSVSTDANYLTPTGHDTLKMLFEEEGEELFTRWNRNIGTWQPTFPVHFMRVVDAILAMQAAAELSGYGYGNWADDDLFTQLKADGEWTGEAKPDGFIEIDTGSRIHSFLIEVDCGSESLRGKAANSWASKMKRYAAMMDHLYNIPFWEGVPMPTILVVAPTKKRAADLKEVAEEAGHRRAWWFATFDVLEDPRTLFAHRWDVIDDPDGRTLAGQFARAAVRTAV